MSRDEYVWRKAVETLLEGCEPKPMHDGWWLLVVLLGALIPAVVALLWA